MLDGLADNTVSSITKDDKGFIWFGNDNGISRYDGKTIVNFNHPEKYLKVRAIKEASANFVWFIANGEILAFSQRHERILPLISEGKPLIGVSDFTIDSDSLLWVLKAGELLRVELDVTGQKEAIQVVATQIIPVKTPRKGALVRLCSVADNRLAIATTKSELVFLDKSAPFLCDFTKWDKGGNINPYALIYENNQLWISTIGSGALHYSMQSGEFTQYTYHNNDVHSLSHKDVYEISPLNRGRFIASTWNGVTILNPDTITGKYIPQVYTFSDFQHEKGMESRVLSSFFDSATGILWIGTNGGGIVQLDLKNNFYQQVHQKSHNEIWNIEQDKEGFLWFTSFHNGIMRSDAPFDPQTELNIHTVNESFAQKGVIYRCMVKDKSGNFWLGGSQGSFFYFNPTQNTKEYFTLPLERENLQYTDILSLFLDDQNVLWIGTDKGLFVFNKAQSDKPYKIITPNSANNNLFIRSITGDASHNIWIGSPLGVHKYKNGLMRDYSYLYPTDIRALFYSPDGNLYIGSQNGLFIHNCASDSTAAVYTTRNGLCNNFIGCITEDAKGRLWIGSNSGISKFNKEQGVFYHFYISGNNRTVLRSDSLLFWGNNKTLTYFNPRKAGIVQHENRHVYLTQLDVNNEPVQVGQKKNGQLILEESISSTNHIELNPKNNKFAFHFSNLSYNPELQKYYYRLYPYEKEWQIAEGSEKVSYALLPPGEYRFEVKTLFQEGEAGLPTVLKVVIQPHWSQTVWFYLGCLLGIGLVMAYLLRWNRIKQKRKEQAAALNQELERVNYERKKEQQINDERIRFFTNASHELRTPLTLITAPLSELLADNEITDKTRCRLQLINEHASLLQTTVNELLYVQKINASLVELRPSLLDMKEIVRKVANSFSELIQIHHQHLSVEMEEDMPLFWFDGSKMESAIRNLLSNAIKYTPREGKIQVRVFTTQNEHTSYCRITISDNGPGIDKKDQHRIFEPFTTTDNEPLVSGKLGLGLRIVKNTADLHHGMIELVSEKGEGCCFTLSIPMTITPAIPSIPVLSPICGINKEYALGRKKSTGKTLLIIEDNAEIQQYIGLLFEEHYQLLFAQNGEEGIQTAIQQKPDLIISDIMMPVKDGIACCKELRENLTTAHIPIILLTAKTEEADQLVGMKVGADDYLMKPFNPEILKVKVENLIRSREQLKRLYTKAVIRSTTSAEKHVDAETETSEGAISEATVSVANSSFMQQTINLIEKNLTNPEFNVRILARELNMSQPTLYRKIKKESDLSISEVIRSVRMSKSASLLMDKRYSIQEVAEMVGFNDIATFRKHFMEQFGVQPSKYMAQD